MFHLMEVILDLIPKSTEIEYKKKIPEVLRLIPTADQGKTVEVAFSKLLTHRRTDGPTHGRTDRWTDKASYRVAFRN